MKHVLPFLRKIQKNNNRDWMLAHKEDYLEAKAEFDFLVQEIIARASTWDQKLPMLEPKNCTFRINRDVRFSDDKRPYKDNMGAYISYDGKKGILPGYYLNLSTKEIFVAGGLWHPEPNELLKVRRAIANQGEDLIKILNDKKFKKTFGDISTEDSLKRVPKGFDPDHEMASLLKLKSFVVRRPFGVSDVTEKGFGKKIDDIFKLIKPFNEFLVKALKE